MKPLLILTTLFGFFASLLSAQTTTAPAKTKDAVKRHSLWTATKGDKTIHLLGSVHVTTDDMLPLPKVMDDALAQSSGVMFETDLAAMMEPATQIKMAALTMYGDGTTLKDHVPEKLYKDTEAYLQKKGIPMQFMSRMKPWALAISVIPLLEMKEAGFDVTSGGVDKILEKKAKEAGKKVIPLENLEFYQKLFASLDDDEQVALLEATLKEAPETAKLSKEMIQHWLTGNGEHLEALINKSMAGHEDLQKKLLYDRNDDWVPKILKASGEHPELLVVVGAGHLVGKHSLAELLEKQGWKITQQ